MESCVGEARPKYWDEMTLDEKVEVLRSHLSSMIEEVLRLRKLRQHTHSLSGRVVYEDDELPPRSYKLPIDLQRKPRTIE